MHKFLLAVGAAGALLLGTHRADAVEIGLYAGPGCDGLSHLTGYAGWLGVPAHHVTENFDQSSWANLASDAEWSIGCYAKVRSTVSFTFSIPMLPADGVSTLAKGAAGAYDSYFIAIAKDLVAHDLGTSIIRIGWEFNGNWQPWSSYKDNKNFVKYYQRLVTLMRSVPGARFLFEWCPNVGTGTLAPDQSYPGDEFVDIFGLDIYDGHWSTVDATPQGRWNYFVTEPYGLQWQVREARYHNKRVSWPEWGCCGDRAGDDPYFISHAAEWLKTYSYLYADYWDSNTAYRGELTNEQYPEAAKAYITDFGR
jgi:hypothetical protein